jgi:hypothetical protein
MWLVGRWLLRGSGYAAFLMGMRVGAGGKVSICKMALLSFSRSEAEMGVLDPWIFLRPILLGIERVQFP